MSPLVVWQGGQSTEPLKTKSRREDQSGADVDPHMS